jgi:hypothetical protein
VQQGAYERTREIHNDTKNIRDDTENIRDDTRGILVRRSTAWIWLVLITRASRRKLSFWQSWSLYAMPGTRLVITKGAFPELENPSSRISCSGLKTHRPKTCFG